MNATRSHIGEKTIALYPTIVFTCMFGVIMALFGFIGGDKNASDALMPLVVKNTERVAEADKTTAVMENRVRNIEQMVRDIWDERKNKEK